MRNWFDRELENLNLDLIKMGSLIEEGIESAIRVLKDGDLELIETVINDEKRIDEMERAIESKCLKLLLQQQPVAKDLRLISTALKIVTDMERISDQAKDITEIGERLIGQTRIKELVHIPKMAEKASEMVRLSVDAFVRRDLELAQSIEKLDDEVDDMFNEVKNDLIELIIKDKKNTDQAVDLLMAAKYLEKIGDHAVNISEWVIFSVTGEHKNYRVF